MAIGSRSPVWSVMAGCGFVSRRPSGLRRRCSCSRCSGRSRPRSRCGSPPRTGRGSRSSSARAVISIPGVQKPQCSACSSWKPCWTGSSWPSSSSDSTVRISWPSAHRRQDRARLDRLAVHQHHAGAAVGRVTAPVGAGQARRVADEVHQQQARLDLAGDRAVR